MERHVSALDHRTGGTTTTLGTLAATSGNTYCFVVIAHASDGGTSAATAETCTVVPLDDRSLTRSGTWSLGTGTAYFKSTFCGHHVGSEAHPDRRRRQADSDRRDDLLDLREGPRLLGFDPAQDGQPAFAHDVNRKVIAVTTFSSVRTGPFHCRVYGSGHKVVIDGVGITGA